MCACACVCFPLFFLFPQQSAQFLILTKLSTHDVNITFYCFIGNMIFCLLCLLMCDLQSFITQDSGDRDFLVKNLQSFDVPILNYVRNESGQKAPFEISKQVYVT